MIATDIVGEGRQQCQSSSDVVVSSSRQTASSYITAATRALKKTNAANHLHDKGGDDCGHQATPSYHLKLPLQAPLKRTYFRLGRASTIHPASTPPVVIPTNESNKGPSRGRPHDPTARFFFPSPLFVFEIVLGRSLVRLEKRRKKVLRCRLGSQPIYRQP